jgi:glycosyltransferase involved in cell wall biosynthesis
MEFDVIITTYNRKENVTKLVNKINTLEPSPNKIIVIDTSDEYNSELNSLEKVLYVRSSVKHQNQPYKRLVGALIATCDNLIFFDDDLIIKDDKIFQKLLPIFEYQNFAGVTCAIDFQNKPVSTARRITTKISRYLQLITGVPYPEQGKLSLLGIYTTPQRDKVREVEALHGPVMGFKRKTFLELPYDEMLVLFDKQLIIPEDKLLSIRCQKHGKLYHYPEELVIHPKIKSTYFLNLRDHTKRVHLSRYYLNYVLGKSSNKEFFYNLHFKYYSFWRKVISLITLAFRNLNYLEKYKGLKDAEEIIAEKSLFSSTELGIIDDAKIDSNSYKIQKI